MLSRLKISHKLWLLTTGVILILSTGFYLYFITLSKSQLQEGLQQKAHGLMQAFAINIGSSLQKNDAIAIKELLDGLENDPDIQFIFVGNHNGDTIYGYRYLTHQNIIDRILQGNQIKREEDGFVVLKQSVFYHDEFVGTLVMGFNSDWVKSELKTQARNLLIISLILVFLLIILSTLLARAISRPLDNAARAIESSSESGGLLGLRLPVEGSNEIAKLSRALNQLAENLDKNISELDASKKYVETLFQLSPIPILITNSLGQIERTNESASSFFGIERSVLLQMNLEKFIQPDDLSAIYNRILQERQEIRGYVTTLRMADNSKRVVELNISGHVDELEYVQNIIIAIIDITEKIEIQREILHSQTKLQRINEELQRNSEELKRLSAVNQQNAQNMARLIQISQEMMRAENPAAILKIVLEEGAKLSQSKEAYIMLWDKRKSGLKASLAFPANNLSKLTTLVQKDSSIFMQTYQRNEALVRDSSEMKKSDLHILGLDDYKEASVFSIPLSERDRRLGILIFIKEKQKNARLEEVHLLTTLANQAALYLENIHLVNALQEKAYHLERAYSELQKSQQQVIQLQKMESLGTLVGGIAHDFNNILGIIIPNTDLLRKDAKGDPQIIRRANIISESAQRAADLTRQLLMFSRNQDIQKVSVSPNKLLQRLSNMLRRTLGKEYEIELKLADNLPNIEADETRLSQVIINLAVNARDAMPEGGKIVIASEMKYYKPKGVNGQKQGKFVCISMKDTGKGIEAEHLDKIFDPFFTTKTLGKGTGLGLSVVYGIIQSHDGFIDVESQVGVGTTVYLYLPPGNMPDNQQKEEKMEKSVRGGGNILVVDDEQMIRDSVREILETFGYKITVAKDGFEAIRQVKETKISFDLAIVDMSMPKMNGIQTIRELKKIDNELRVILSSGHIERQPQLPEDLEIEDTLPKPYRLKELANKVRQILNHPSHAQN